MKYKFRDPIKRVTVIDNVNYTVASRNSTSHVHVSSCSELRLLSLATCAAIVKFRIFFYGFLYNFTAFRRHFTMPNSPHITCGSHRQTKEFHKDLYSDYNTGYISTGQRKSIVYCQL